MSFSGCCIARFGRLVHSWGIVAVVVACGLVGIVVSWG